MKILAAQPKPFYLIFLLEIWKRFGFYGVQTLLVLFMVQQLGFSDSHADFLFTAYCALVFLLPCVGGFIGDQILGTRRTILLGAVTLALGYFLLSLNVFHSAHLLLFPLATIAVGNGLFKANPSSLLSSVYQNSAYNHDSGFTMYYMAVNIGGFISMNLTPILNKYFGWQIAFVVCFIGLVAAIINFIVMRKLVQNYGSEPDHRPLRVDYLMYVILFTAALIFACYFLLHYYQIMSQLLIFGTGILFLVYLWFIKKAEP